MKKIPKVSDFTVKFLIKFLKDPCKYLESLQQEYGDIYYKKFAGYLHYFLSHPRFVEHILTKNPQNYDKYPIVIENFSPVLGKDNMLLSNNWEKWQEDRSLADSSFQSDVYFERYTNTVVRNTLEMTEEWMKKYLKPSSSCPIGRELDLLALKNINTTIFHNMHIDPKELIDNIPLFFDLIMKKATSITKIPWIFPSPRKKAFEKVVSLINQLKKEAVIHRLQEGKDYDDLLGTFLAAYKVNDTKCPHIEKVANQIITFDVAGFTTTTSALRSIFAMILQYPETEQKILTEMNEICSNGRPTYEGYEQLHYTKAVVRESLRLNAPLIFIQREVKEDDEIDQYLLKKGYCLSLNLDLIHRHPDFWDNPDEFRPERFLNNPHGQENPYAYIPFGSGKRSCVAKGFAFLEMVLITGILTQRFSFSLEKNTKLSRKYIAAAFMRPNLEMVRVEKRK